MNIVDEEQNGALEKLEHMAKQQLVWTRLGAMALVGTFVVVLITILVMAPRVGSLLNQTRQAVSGLEEVTEQLRQADLPGLLDQVDSLVGQSTETASAAMEKIKDLDVEALNQAITDLKNVVSPLARLFGNG
ncbi:MAG: hypothetical protein PHD67_04975 [Oscillospiraceae bacterium]|nr:hypothetical protein [Oscillospiraceae bacterium]